MNRPVLSRSAHRTLRALAEVVAPNSAALSVDLDGIVAFVDDIVRHMPRLLRVAFPIGLWLLEVGTWFWGGSWRRFSRLDRAARERYVRGWIGARSALRRDLIKGVKGLVLLAFYGDPRVMEKIGYRPGPFVELVTAERLRLHGHNV